MESNSFYFASLLSNTHRDVAGLVEGGLMLAPIVKFQLVLQVHLSVLLMWKREKRRKGAISYFLARLEQTTYYETVEAQREQGVGEEEEIIYSLYL